VVEWREVVRLGIPRRETDIITNSRIAVVWHNRRICAWHRQWPLEEDLQRWVVRLDVRLGVVHLGRTAPHRVRQEEAFTLPFSSFLFPEQASL